MCIVLYQWSLCCSANGMLEGKPANETWKEFRQKFLSIYTVIIKTNLLLNLLMKKEKESIGSLHVGVWSVSNFRLQSHNIYEGGGQSFLHSLTFDQVLPQRTHYSWLLSSGSTWNKNFCCAQNWTGPSKVAVQCAKQLLLLRSVKVKRIWMNKCFWWLCHHCDAVYLYKCDYSTVNKISDDNLTCSVFSKTSWCCPCLKTKFSRVIFKVSIMLLFCCVFQSH